MIFINASKSATSINSLISGLLLQILNTFADRKVFLRAVLPDNEEAAGLLVLGMWSHFESIVVFQLIISLVVELEDLLEELGICLRQLITVLHVIQDGPCLRLDLIDVHVVDAGNRVGSLLLLYLLLALLILILHAVLLRQSHFGRRAVVKVASVLLPEVIQFLSLNFRKIKFLAADELPLESRQLLDLLLGRLVGRHGQVTVVLVAARVGDFDLIILLLDKLLNIFPSHLIILILLLILILRAK